MNNEIAPINGKLYFPFNSQGCYGCAFCRDDIADEFALIDCTRPVYDDNGNMINCICHQWRVCTETEINY